MRMMLSNGFMSLSHLMKSTLMRKDEMRVGQNHIPLVKWKKKAMPAAQHVRWCMALRLVT
jgi:hypothetical protein